MIVPVLAKKRSERDLVLGALLATLEQIPTAAFVANGQGSICFANGAAHKLRRHEPGIETELARAIAGQRTERRFGCTPLPLPAVSGWYLVVETAQREGAEQRVTKLGLTPRQRDVALLVLRGATNLTIAELLGISERTVETHLTAVYQRAGVENRASLVSFLLTTGRTR